MVLDDTPISHAIPIRPEEVTPVNVRIGIADATREIELEVEEPESLEAELDKAFSDGTSVYWITDSNGNRFGIPMARIAYVEIIGEQRTSVGFG
ncbi:MAG TPA: DUF3107 domain-containing protein [Actinobacteria bacterium]|nr:DUF3107 domain-containing protein [Actinomycetota bacterium]